MRYVDVRGLNNFQSFLTPCRVPSVIRLYREDGRYRVQAALGGSEGVLPAARKCGSNSDKEEGQLAVCDE